MRLAALLSLLALLGAAPGCQTTRLGRRPHAALDHGDQETSITALGIDGAWARDGGWAVSPPLDAAAGATRVSALATLLSGDSVLPPLEARGLASGEPVTDWVPLAPYFEDGELRVATAELGLLVDGAELRVPEAALESLADLRWSAIDPDELLGESPLASEGVTVAPLRSELSGLGIVTRAEWGARSTSCGPVDGARSRISIHHTEGPASDPMRQLRGIQSYHISKGWCDIGYHFLIDATGRIYEGRALELRGTHVRNNNTGNIGIAFIGCFDDEECSAPTPISDAMIESAGRLVGTLARLYGITPSSTSVRGHRDQVSTTCPGDRMYARIGDIVRIATVSSLETDAPVPAPAPSPAPSGSVCRHSLGGTYASGACSESYQCCDGAWRTRASGCGVCVCVEGSGRTGCTATGATPTDPPPEPAPTPTPEPTAPPAGASCAHSFGGTYANTACSASYQCCDGSWRARTSGCGACFCVEESGTSGCGLSSAPTPTPAPSGLPIAGLTLSGSEIPRAGLANATLRATLGVSTEPYGTVESYEGASFVRGRVSWFGGPRDTGVTTTETGAVSGERLRSLNDPVSPDAATLAARPEDYYYVAMRWAYSPNGTSWWRNARLLVVNPATGAAIVVRPVDWGPNTSTRRILDLSPQALTDLGLSTDGEALVTFAPAGTPLGRVR